MNFFVWWTTSANQIPDFQFLLIKGSPQLQLRQERVSLRQTAQDIRFPLTTGISEQPAREPGGGPPGKQGATRWLIHGGTRGRVPSLAACRRSAPPRGGRAQVWRQAASGARRGSSAQRPRAAPGSLLAPPAPQPVPAFWGLFAYVLTGKLGLLTCLVRASRQRWGETRGWQYRRATR